jgi:hypothetical protein
LSERALKYLWKNYVPAVLLWNAPIIIALFAYGPACDKMIFLQTHSFKIALWNPKTEMAINATIWLYCHAWVFLVVAIVSNAVYLFFPRRRPYWYLAWIMPIVVSVPALWYAYLGLYLNGKALEL